MRIMGVGACNKVLIGVLGGKKGLRSKEIAILRGRYANEEHNIFFCVF